VKDNSMANKAINQIKVGGEIYEIAPSYTDQKVD
jgi:hypothetical protein